jgi:uncharacterized protein (DUF433 family)
LPRSTRKQVPGNDFISSTPGVCGGAARIRGTRIPVWLLEEFRRGGYAQADILEMYPHLEVGQVEAALTFAQRHATEMNRLIAKNR